MFHYCRPTSPIVIVLPQILSLLAWRSRMDLWELFWVHEPKGQVKDCVVLLGQVLTAASSSLREVGRQIVGSSVCVAAVAMDHCSPVMSMVRSWWSSPWTGGGGAAGVQASPPSTDVGADVGDGAAAPTTGGEPRAGRVSQAVS